MTDGIEEIWRPVPGSAGRYEASSLGRIRRVTFQVRQRDKVQTYRGRILCGGPSHRGYLRVKVVLDGKRSPVAIHRLVALAFHGAPPEGRPHVNHINGKNTDNRPSNLEWLSNSENAKHAARLGLRPRGERHPLAKLTALDVGLIRQRCAAGEAQATVGGDYGITQAAVSAIVLRQTWRHVP